MALAPLSPVSERMLPRGSEHTDNHRVTLRFVSSTALCFWLALLPASVTAQSSGWDSPRALELIERARAQRLLPARDTLLRNYTASAEGFVYFYLDRRDTNERTLVKTDQVALELFWAAPDRTKQRIVGLRDASRFPNRMYYHLDHLTVVQDGFGDVIRMGDGDEVRDVPHPAAPGSAELYQFRLADSLTLQLPSAEEPIRVYELQVRPRSIAVPAIVGSVFVDRRTADIVRMSFTFTPVSYVDDRLDHITVSLDNGLWEGRYWLPYEQTLQIRRQVPELDFAASAVIQGRMRIGDYVFNDTLSPATFIGPSVVALSPERLARHEFDRDIYEDLNEAGLAPPAGLTDVRRQAAELLADARLSGLPGWRLGLGSVSSALRFNRAEGIALGLGIVYDPGPPWRVDLTGGYAFGAEHAWAGLTARRETSQSGAARLHVAVRDRRDLGLRPAVPELVNTITAVAAGDDYSDLFYATGARVAFQRALGRTVQTGVELAAERHSSAHRVVASAPLNDAKFRPVRAVDEGDLSSATAWISRSMPDPTTRSWGAAANVELGTFASQWYLRPVVDASFSAASTDHARELLLTASLGAVLGESPSQRLFLLGGMNTLPGYAHRSFLGSHFAVARAEAGIGVLDPWIRLRLLGAAGSVGGLDFSAAAEPIPEESSPAWRAWGASGSDGVRYSAGAGVSLFWDLLRVDYVRGLDDGESQVLISFHPDFWDIS